MSCSCPPGRSNKRVLGSEPRVSEIAARPRAGSPPRLWCRHSERSRLRVLLVRRPFCGCVTTRCVRVRPTIRPTRRRTPHNRDDRAVDRSSLLDGFCGCNRCLGHVPNVRNRPLVGKVELALDRWKPLERFEIIDSVLCHRRGPRRPDAAAKLAVIDRCDLGKRAVDRLGMLVHTDEYLLVGGELLV